MRSKVLISLAISLTVLLSGSSVLAYNYNLPKAVQSVENLGQRLEDRASQSAIRQNNDLSNLKSRADRLIEQRISKLQDLSNRINNDHRLSADEKSQLSTSIQTNILGLTDLKTKIDTETNLATAQTDAKTIYTGYRVYAVVTPQTQIVIIIDNLQTLTSNLETLTPKLQDLLNNLKTQGIDISSAQASLNDINSKLADINTKLASDKTQVLAVTINTQNPQAVFSSVRKDLSQVRQDFADIMRDLESMRNELQQSVSHPVPSKTSSSSAAVTH